MIFQRFLKTTLLLIAMMAFSACGDFQLNENFVVEGSGDQSSNNSDQDTTPAPNPGPSGGPVGSFSAISVPDMELGDSQTVSFRITADNAYSGLVSLDVDRSALAGVSGNQDITFEFNPAQIQLVAGQQSAPIELTVDSKISSPSFNTINGIKVIATSEDGDGKESDASFSLMVKPEITIEMYGLQDAMGNAIPPAERFNRPSVMNFRAHTSNLKLKFVNMDTQATHIVHGNNPIQHGSTAVPQAVAPSADTPGGTHEPEIEPTDNNIGSYYYHGEEGNGQARTMNFHQVNPSSASIMSLTDHEIAAANIRMLKASMEKQASCDDDPDTLGGE